MTSEFKYQVFFQVKCVVCEELVCSDHRVAAFCPAPLPPLPPGWRVLDGNLICTKHNVVIKDKKAKTEAKIKTKRN